MLELILVVIRAVQFIFAIIVLGLTGHVASFSYSPSQNNFMIFTSVWTLLALLYLALAPRFFSSVAHVMAIFALDALTMLFWFAGFIALAVFRSALEVVANDIYTHGCSALFDVCPTLEAAVVFGAFEWVLFLITTVLGALDAFKNRNKSASAPATTTTTTTTA